VQAISKQQQNRNKSNVSIAAAITLSMISTLAYLQAAQELAICTAIPAGLAWILAWHRSNRV